MDHELITPATEREIQLEAAAHHRLLPGDLLIDEHHLEVRGIAIAPEGLKGTMAFFLNGQPFDEVLYPVSDENARTCFSWIEGAAGFGAYMRTRPNLQEARFFRVDASPTGHFVEGDWRHAMWFMNPAHEQFPMPPPANIQRVIGDQSEPRFSLGGATIIHNIRATLREMGRDWSGFRTILDWGCGAGRVTRYLLTETDAAVHGADIDATNIDWCRANLIRGHFTQVPLAPPTQFPGDFFDLVVGVSVLTHLNEPMQFAWLDELRRITRSGALLFLSVAGPVQFAYMGIPVALYQRTQEAGFLDAARDPALDGHIDDTEYYRSIWHSRRYINENWTRYFEVLAIIDGVAALQDFVVLRRR